MLSAAERRAESLKASAVAPPAEVGRYRWVICGLLFAAMVCNYIDRQMIGLLKPTLQRDLGWTEAAYADIVFWFQAAYAASYLLFGRFIDKVGARIGYAWAFAIWTIGHIAHAGARSALQFTLARVVLGVGEGGSFPAGLKAVAEWFPKRERAFAVGLLNAGTNIGAIATPLIVPAITLTLGWRWAFVVTGILTSSWLVGWLLIYRRPREHRRVGASEVAYIESDPPDRVASVSWREVLRCKETWAYAAGKFLIDPVWWMFLFWLPDFLAKRHGLDLKSFGPPLVIIYVISDLGSVAGGWFSSTLIKRGRSVNFARKLAMLAAAVAVLPVAFAASIDSLWLAVAVVGLATAAHQWFSCNLYTLPSDVFPRGAVASVAGIGGTAGAVGGMLMSQFVGSVLERVGSYTPIFATAACVYLLALLVIHVIMPRYAEVGLAPAAPAGTVAGAAS
jgi:MFS transporter, ACS family, hexuronate transporter